MGTFSQRTPPVKSISQAGLLIMLVPLFFLVFFASCIHVESRPYLGMGDPNAENMNVNMNGVKMSIEDAEMQRSRDAFGGWDYAKDLEGAQGLPAHDLSQDREMSRDEWYWSRLMNSHGAGGPGWRASSSGSRDPKKKSHLDQGLGPHHLPIR